jgi:hypothetical protein
LARPSTGISTTLEAGSNEGTVAYTLAGIKDWTFLGPGWVVGWGNGLILGYLMYRSELMPRRACWLALIGGPLRQNQPRQVGSWPSQRLARVALRSNDRGNVLQGR